MKLEARGLGKCINKNNWLFQHVDLTLHSGKIIGLQGPSGCGKSSLCRLIAGMEAPTQGSVLLDGRPLQKRGYQPIQLVFQHPERAVNPRWRVRSIVSEGWMPDDELLESLHIDRSWLDRWPSELSGGQLQRICIARALSPQTKFLIADEMTTMLDAITQVSIWKTVLDIASERHMGLLVVSHDRHLLNRICNQVIDFHSISHTSVS